MITETGNPVRDIGHARWIDPLAFLEQTDGKEFKAAVSAEDKIWSSKVRGLKTAVASWKRDMEKFQHEAWPEVPEFAHIKYGWNGVRVAIQHATAGYTFNVWFLDCENKPVWSITGISDFGTDAKSSVFYMLVDIGEGAEKLELRVCRWKDGHVQKLWKRSPVGPTVAIRGEHIFYTGVENALRYNDVRRADLKTGRGERILFTEPDKRVQVSLEERDDCIFVHLANALFQRLGVLQGSSRVEWITETEKSTLIPIARHMYATDRHLVAGRTKHSLPAGEHIVDAAAYTGDKDGAVFVTTTNKGCSSLWLFTAAKEWKSLIRFTEGALSDIVIFHDRAEYPSFLVHCPETADVVYEFRPLVGLVPATVFPTPLKLHTLDCGTAKSADGTHVPYTVVSAVKNPKKLLVDGYGAYGVSSRRCYPIRWLSWLARGYAFAYSCPRGGREGGDPWYDAGRTALRKHHTFEDVGAAIATIQKRVGISAKHTLFFGRSAGGWLAARIAQDYGHLVAGVYAEVPYVDVLRTTTNPALPLTQLEYDEFGDPIGRPAEFKALQKLSPVDTVSACTACPTLVIRTGVNDMQVLPYEALKWAIELREAGWPNVFVGIDHNGGHFASAKSMNQQRAEDAAILDAAIQTRSLRTSRKSFTKRSPGRSVARKSGRGRTRRLTSSRKQRTRQATSSPAS
jgi:hypothetical protein